MAVTFRTSWRILTHPDPIEAAARIRAAVAQSDLTMDEVARAIGVSASMLKRMASPTSPRGATPGQLEAIADITGMARNYMRHGDRALDLVVFDEQGRPVSIVSYKDLTAARNEAVHHGVGSGKSLAYRVAAIEALLTQWLDENPEAFTGLGLGPFPDLPAESPSEENARPSPGSDEPSPEPSGHHRAADRRRVA